jgi:hypothetical protein
MSSREIFCRTHPEDCKTPKKCKKPKSKTAKIAKSKGGKTNKNKKNAKKIKPVKLPPSRFFFRSINKNILDYAPPVS